MDQAYEPRSFWSIRLSHRIKRELLARNICLAVESWEALNCPHMPLLRPSPQSHIDAGPLSKHNPKPSVRPHRLSVPDRLAAEAWSRFHLNYLGVGPGFF